jgi:hypothetical protein
VGGILLSKAMRALNARDEMDSLNLKLDRKKRNCGIWLETALPRNCWHQVDLIPRFKIQTVKHVINFHDKPFDQSARLKFQAIS